MHSTYINDNMLSVYPFAPGVRLPFSCGCIQGIGLCLNDDYTRPKISSIQITADSVAALVVDQRDERLCMLRADSKKSECIMTDHDDLKLSGWIAVGSIQPHDIGEYKGPFHVDPSCIHRITGRKYAGISNLTVNGIHEKLTKPVLKVSFSGLIGASVTSEHSVSLTGYPGKAATHVQTVKTNTKVLRINGIAVESTAPEMRDGTWMIESADNDVLSISLDNALDYTDIKSKYLDQYKDVPFEGLATILTINGSKAIPSCFNPEEDEADAADL